MADDPPHNVRFLRPVLRGFIADAALEAIGLASKGVEVSYASYGVMGHFVVLEAPSTLPEYFLTRRFALAGLQIALQTAAAEACAYWVANGRPNLRILRREEPSWMTHIIESHTDALLRVCGYIE